MKLQIHN